MNNEIKQILKNQKEILSYILTQYDRESSFSEDVRVLIKETEGLLNPKEDVPYEKSIEEPQRICANCNYFESVHGDPKFFDKENVCNKFVKSSKTGGNNNA